MWLSRWVLLSERLGPVQLTELLGHFVVVEAFHSPKKERIAEGVGQRSNRVFEVDASVVAFALGRIPVFNPRLHWTADLPAGVVPSRVASESKLRVPEAIMQPWTGNSQFEGVRST